MTGFDSKRAAAADKLQETNITRPCRSCNGTGDRDTGIPESPIATCKPCNGTGQIALAQPAQDEKCKCVCHDGCAACRQMAQPAQEPIKLWLWKNFVNGKFEYLAFDNPFPIFMDSHDPQTLGEPCGYALLKPSRAGRTDVSDEQVLQDVQKALAQPADNPYGYDWSMLEAAQESLREHMARIKELEAQLSQPAQGHVAWVCEGCASDEKHAIDYWQEDVDDIPIGTLLYAAPPQREWVGLTEKEAKSFISFYKMDIVRFVEAKLKEKNNGT